MRTIAVRAAAAAVVAFAASCFAAEESSAGGGGRLDVAGGGLAGELAPVPAVDGGSRETFLWKSSRFAEPLEFRIGEVAGITYPDAQPAPEPQGTCVQLRGGDVVPVDIESLDADTLVVTTAGPDGPQRLRIARAEVAAIVRGGGGVGSYAGPTGLTGWEQAPAGSWREEAGRIMTEKSGAAVTRDVTSPMRARFTMRLSRRRGTEFRVAVAAAERPADDGYVLQAVGADANGGLMLVRRSGGRAAIQPLPEAPWRADVLRVVLFVDQERGRLAVMLPDAEGEDGRTAFEVRLPAGDVAQPSGRFRLELTSGDICLERLEVTPWRGDAPTLRDGDETTILTRTGGIEGFTVTSFDAATKEFVLARGDEEKRVAAAVIDEIRFPDAGEDPAGEPVLRIVRTDGCAVSGDLVKIDDRAVWLSRRGIDVPLAVSRDSIFTVRSQRPTARRQEPVGRVGTLVAGDDRLRGWLAEGPGGGLGWRPLGATAAVSLAADALDAEVEYVARSPEKKGAVVEVGGIGGLVNRDAEGVFIVAMMTEDGAAARDGRIQAGDRIIAVAPTARSRFVETKDLDNETVTQLLRGRIGTIVRLKVTDGLGENPRDIDLPRGPISVAGREILEQALQTHLRLAGVDQGDDAESLYPALVILRSGDVASCRIEAVDADAVTLRSPLTGGAEAAAVAVPVALVKAVELLPTAASRSIDKTLRDRLLTLPRMQRDRPPTHLLRLVDGDYLRGRLVKVDDKIVTFEVLDVVKQLPREQVARLIWLHPEIPRADGAENVEAPAEPPAQPDGLVVQGVATDGRRITLVAEGVAGNELRGRSEAFGESGIDLTQIDRLLVGGAIVRDIEKAREQGRELPFAQWVLKPAAEPRALSQPEEE